MKHFILKRYTIIEAIVIISIIALILAITIPVILTVKQAGNNAVNISNLKQIGIAMTSYANSHNGYYPRIENISNNSKCLWLLLPEVNYNVNIFYPPNSEIYKTAKSNYLFKNPHSLYKEILNNPSNSSIPAPGYAYSPTVWGEPLSANNINYNVPIVTNYNNNDSKVYYLSPDGSVRH